MVLGRPLLYQVLIMTRLPKAVSFGQLRGGIQWMKKVSAEYCMSCRGTCKIVFPVGFRLNQPKADALKTTDKSKQPSALCSRAN